MTRRSVSCASLRGAYVARRVRKDGAVKVAGRRWRPRGREAEPGTWLGFCYSHDTDMLELTFPGLGLPHYLRPAKIWEPVG
jgi:hypothetical protein